MKLKIHQACTLVCLAVGLIFSGARPYAAQFQTRVLIFSKTTGFRHDSITDGIAAIRQLGQQNGFEVDATEDASAFNDGNLARYQTTVFLCTTGDVLDNDQQAAFERYVRNGGGFVGVHSATDTEYDWAWYGGLIGAYFSGHPETQPARIRIEDSSHPSTSPLPVEWQRTDEWYNFRLNPRGRVKVLATLDETTYNGGGMGADHPIAWCQLYGGGRSWYTAGGHTNGSYGETLFRQHLLGGIQFTAKIRDGACSALTGVSAASFKSDSLASESIASVFGSDLSISTEAAILPLPTTLANTSLIVRDSAGSERLAQLFYVSPTQINFLVPNGIANGSSIFTVVKSDATAPSGMTQIAPVAPGLFAANATGRGIPAGLALRVRQTGSQQYEPIARFDPSQNAFVPVPIDLGVATDNVFLVLFATGIRFPGSLSTITATIGGIPVQVTFAGPQGNFVGLDQINLLLPRILAGRGEVDVVIAVDGIVANTLRANFK
ncbi:MAG: ThuA domain-containing protein [Acidobacteria bacterium]|nr:ThuA domain-containing protein [Acidobacteriota bacterium]